MGFLAPVRCACLEGFSACEIERRPRGASRGKPAPTVCFGPISPVQLPLSALVHDRRQDGKQLRPPQISKGTNKADSGDLTGGTGPKQTVGAGLPREAPRGRRSISQALKPSRHAHLTSIENLKTCTSHNPRKPQDMYIPHLPKTSSQAPPTPNTLSRPQFHPPAHWQNPPGQLPCLFQL